MAEVSVSVDDRGSRQYTSEPAHEASGQPANEAADVEQPPASSTPTLPADGDVRPAVREAPATRPISPEEWVREEDYWDTQSLIAVTGRMAVPRPRARSLKPPQRFRPVQRWKSVVALAVVSACILGFGIGLVQASHLAGGILRPAATHTAVPAPTVTATATAKPKKK